MSWEIVAMVAVLATIFMIVGLFIAVIAKMITDMRTAREIELFKAGLMPPGWKRRHE